MMEKESESIRSRLPKDKWEEFDGIVSQQILGATRHIELIGDFIEAIADDSVSSGESTREMIERIRDMTGYFIRTRGAASQAVANGIRLMVRGMSRQEDMEPERARDAIVSAKDACRKISQEAVCKVITYSVALAEQMECFFLFDYSSTVDKFLEKLAEDGRRRTLYIAESRLIHGGRPYVKRCQDRGYKIHFIPDAASMSMIPRCDGIFMGAETIYPNGTCFNTIGSDMVGLAADYYHIPLYFLSPLIKLDFRYVEGRKKEMVWNGLEEDVNVWFEEQRADLGRIDYLVPELVGVRPEFIEGIVTERGIVPPLGMYGVALSYRKYLEGGAEEDVQTGL